MYVKDIMTKDVITISEDDTVEKCANLLATHHLSGLPVVDADGYIKGIVTEGDLIKHNSTVQVPAFIEILGGIIYLDSPKRFFDNVKKSMGHFAKTVMTEDITTISPDEKVENAASLLVQKELKRLPVLNEEGKLVGIVSRRDIMNHLFRNK